MTELAPIKAAEAALFWGAINTMMKGRMADARAEALRLLSQHQIMSQAVLDDTGVRLGTVTWFPPAEGLPVVSDHLALLRWVKRNRPDEVVVVESVRESYVKNLIDNAKANPEKVPIDKATGEVIPGISVPEVESVGRLRVVPSAEGKARIKELLLRGENLRALTAPTGEAPDGF